MAESKVVARIFWIFPRFILLLFRLTEAVFLIGNILFSALILTQRFNEKWSFLYSFRGAFQEKVLSQNGFEDKLMVLKAPTGIGKTKIFLDIVNRLSQKREFERVFYFSPLLALTEDFEAKLFGKNEVESVLKRKDLEKVLIYNHAFAGSLLKKTSGVVSDEGNGF